MIVMWWNRDGSSTTGLQVKAGHTDPAELVAYAFRSHGHAIVVGSGVHRFDDARFCERRP